MDFRPVDAPEPDPVDDANARIALLEAELRGAEALLRRAQNDAALLRKTIDEQKTRIAELESRQRDELAARVRERDEHSEAMAALQARVESAEARASRMDDLERKLSEAEQRAPQPSAEDLTAIRGIGRAFDRALKANGVFRIAQIAAWTDEDIDRLAPLIKTQPDRIRRDGWVASARKLLGV